MFDPERAPAAALEPLRSVVTAVLSVDSGLKPGDLMVVGARARDIMHAALGQESPTKPTSDLDLAIGLRSWSAYDELINEFPPTRGNANDIRYTIAGCPTDLLVFGEVENPTGKVTPPPRKDPVEVWGFEEVHRRSLPLLLDENVEIRIPTVPGYVALKLAAWLDRGAPNDSFVYKDAVDIGLAMRWYADSDVVTDRLYETSAEILEAEDYDQRLASVHLLGLDVIRTIGPTRQQELLARWDSDQLSTLAEQLMIPNELSSVSHDNKIARRRETLDALTRGLKVCE